MVVITISVAIQVAVAILQVSQLTLDMLVILNCEKKMNQIKWCNGVYRKAGVSRRL